MIKRTSQERKSPTGALFDRVAGIIDQACVGVVRAVNSHTVIAHWFPGRGIAQGIQVKDGRFRAPDGNPTVGPILYYERNETIPRYSVLADARQLFASKCRLRLPTEDELAAELKRGIPAIWEGARG